MRSARTTAGRLVWQGGPGPLRGRAGLCSSRLNWDVIALRDQLRRRADIAGFMVEVDEYFCDELSHVECAKRRKAEQSVGRQKRAKWRWGGETW